jgi:hypothetical protein
MELLQTNCYLTDPYNSIEHLISILHFLIRMKLQMETEKQIVTELGVQ